MPVGNQWKAKAKEDAAAKAAAAAAAAAPPPVVEPQPSHAEDSRGKKSFGGNFRSKSGTEIQSKAGSEPPVESNESGPVGKSKSVVAGKWTASHDDAKVVRKKRLEVSEDAPSDTSHVTQDGIILENEPVRLEGVVRSDDPSEFQKPLELEKGWAKNLASRFQQQQQPSSDTDVRRSFKLDVEIGAEPEVHENEPVVLEGVVRSSDRTDDVIGKRGNIKSIAGRFVTPEVDSANGGENSSARSERQAPRRSVLERFDRGPIDSDGNAVVLSENVPEELDPNVVRSTDGYRANDHVMQAGWARNMADRFRSSKPIGDDGSDDERPVKSSKPAWLIELEKAKEAETRIVENEPEVRDDVIRADDDTPDIISVQHTRSLRQMWNQIEREKEAAERQPKNRPLPPVVKPKEPSPEPEPPKPPPEEPKPAGRFAARRTIGRFQKEEPTKPATAPVPDPVPAAGGGKLASGKPGIVSSRLQQQKQQQQSIQQAPVAEVEAKGSKLNTRQNLKSVGQLRK